MWNNRYIIERQEIWMWNMKSCKRALYFLTMESTAKPNQLTYLPHQLQIATFEWINHGVVANLRKCSVFILGKIEARPRQIYKNMMLQCHHVAVASCEYVRSPEPVTPVCCEVKNSGSMRCMMMIIAFMTWNSNLVVLMEGLCSSLIWIHMDLSSQFLAESNRGPRD